MCTALIALLLTFAWEVGADNFFYDDNLPRKDFNSMSVYVSLDDNAKEGCWTNFREAREYAEERLRSSGFIVVQERAINANASMYPFSLSVIGLRTKKMVQGPVLGSHKLS